MLAFLLLALAALAPAGALRIPNTGKPTPGKGPAPRGGRQPAAARRGPPAPRGDDEEGEEAGRFAPRAWLEARAESARSALLSNPLGERVLAVGDFLRAPVPVPGWVAASTVAAGSALVGGVALVSVHLGSPTEIEKQALLFGDVLQQVEQGYVQPVDTRALFERGTNAMLHSLDPFTEFENTAARADLDLFTAGAYGGVGLGIAPDPYIAGRILVRDAREGYAYDAGLRVGDHLISIGGEKVSGGSLDRAMGLLRGEPGSQVDIEFSRDGDAPGAPARLATLQRKQVLVPAVSLAALAPLGKGSACGYVKLSAFSSTASAEFRSALGQLSARAAEQGSSLDGLVLDLRGNSGGLLNAALEVNEALLPHGAPLVTTQGREPSSRVTFVSGGAPVLPPSVRMAVLVDGRTASASEIVAGALQDLDRALVVGGRSYGKGLVQSVLPLPYGNELKVTVAKYFTPSGRCIQRLAYAGTEGALAPGSALTARDSSRLIGPGDDAPAPPAAGAQPQKLPRALQPIASAALPASALASAAPPADAPAPADAPSPAEAPPAKPQPDVWLSDGGHLIRDADRKSFRTLHGRSVRDGGGIEADVPLPSLRPGPVERQLSEADVFFAFARELAVSGRLPAPGADGGAPAAFAVDGGTLAEFEAFAKRRLLELGVPLRSPLEARLEELSAALQEDEGWGDAELAAQLPAMPQLRAQARAQLDGAILGQERSAIERRIARAVDARSAPDGQLLSRALRSDSQLAAAIATLRSSSIYAAAFNFEAPPDGGERAAAHGGRAGWESAQAQAQAQAAPRAEVSLAQPAAAPSWQPLALAPVPPAGNGGGGGAHAVRGGSPSAPAQRSGRAKGVLAYEPAAEAEGPRNC